ncbi:glycoside hydrolase family 81 protein [Aaosphaeria arxii CBS 175.79]|uniref:Glucan endo-1,3-beta-D-glucosidase 1 n=1 Tax=Aaosphaeria arxii CBS 175.79 TaxID=1450172 RepID=A0A6A5XH43_9PLEO|nr:glycoside hydrolase family 81 protein [Aaosphaeria arxii CBS 175.79]KAF2012189.1 glycoside hydrolase family 81 protein [Aaosphaeria arxii CBS 175.79]
MARLAFLLALSQATLLYALPTRDKVQVPDEIEKREITLSLNLDATTSYSSVFPSSVQSVAVTLVPSVTGSIHTQLPSHGFTRGPLDGPQISAPMGPLSPIQATLQPQLTAAARQPDPNIFMPMESDAPPQQIKARNDHAVPKEHILDQDIPIETNKFYSNFFLGTQTQPVWSHPYALNWAKGHGDTFGIAVAHIERDQLAWGEGDVPRYFIGPVGVQNIVFSAAELANDTVLSVEEPTGFSVYANLAPFSGADTIMSIPVVQGMGFVTALYNKAKPQLNSGTFFRTLEYVEKLNGVTFKYRVTLEDDSEWLLYATPVASLGAVPFDLVDSAIIEGPENFIGMIQVAKNPANSSGEAVYDSTCGAYAAGAGISGSVDGSVGSYTIHYTKNGVQNQTLVMFALPHQVESFSDQTRAALTDISLSTVTKGYARAVVADSITMVEQDLPTTIDFAPWIPASDGGSGGGSNTNLGAIAMAAVSRAGALELNEDFDHQTRLNSMYYSGKGLAKFAGIIYTLQSLAQNTELAAAGLVKLKDAFHVFVNNTQPFPLVYDNVWRGVVSSGTYKNGDTGVDFGNSLYNDHHFHYGYFVWTAAVIGYLDPSWLEEDNGANKHWVNLLVRDYANPSSLDPYFPFQRSFDWFHGHSWAKGLFESGDGKDQESSSEDTFSTYALKMWGKVTGDANMEARGNLQLAVQSRSMRNYFLLEDDNAVQPEQFLPNKVTGILFENKVDHTTYFGGNKEYVQGIHMIPLNPSSAYTRSRKFVQEEWDAYFSDGRVDKVEGGWKGILYANLALIDPRAAYDFFADPKFDIAQLDGGASRTWYLAYAAAMLGDGTAGVGTVDASEEEVEPPEGEEGDVETAQEEEWSPEEEHDQEGQEDVEEVREERPPEESLEEVESDPLPTEEGDVDIVDENAEEEWTPTEDEETPGGFEGDDIEDGDEEGWFHENKSWEEENQDPDDNQLPRRHRHGGGRHPRPDSGWRFSPWDKRHE